MTVVEIAQESLEREIRRVGTELAAAFPSAARHPMRTLDTRAMELASSDRELRAALFRFRYARVLRRLPHSCIEHHVADRFGELS